MKYFCNEMKHTLCNWFMSIFSNKKRVFDLMCTIRVGLENVERQSGKLENEQLANH